MRRSALRRRAAQAARSRLPSRGSLVAALGAGALLALAFPPVALWPAAFASIALLVFACHGVRPANGAISGGLAGITFFAVAWTWIPTAVVGLQQISFAEAMPIFGLFITWHALQFALFGAFVAAQRTLSPLSCVGIAGGWVLLEAIFPRVVPWHLADVLASAATLRQLAEIGGARLLGLVVVFAGTAAAAAALARTPRARLYVALPGIAVIGAAAVFGLLRDADGTASDPLSVLVVQAGTSAGRHGDLDERNAKAWEAYTGITRSAVDEADVSPDLVVWPETVLRVPVLQQPTWRRRVEALSAEFDAPLLLGVLDRDASGGGEFNAALLVDPFRRVLQHPSVVQHPLPRKRQLYRKQVLLPFGEYVPGAASLLPEWQTTGDFVAGEPGAPLRLVSRRWPEVPPSTLAGSICFEAIVPGSFNRTVADGARLLVNLTDDGWFGNGAEPEQHLNATRLRAVETRRWLVRASGSGISAVISPAGEVIAALANGEVGAFYVVVQQRDDKTIYVRTGDLAWILFAAILAAGAAGSRDPRVTCASAGRGHEPA